MRPAIDDLLLLLSLTTYGLLVTLVSSAIVSERISANVGASSIKELVHVLVEIVVVQARAATGRIIESFRNKSNVLVKFPFLD